MRHFFTVPALTVLPPRTRTHPQSSVFLKMSEDAPRGPACLLDAESVPEDEPEEGFGLSTGALALVLGVAGFGRVSHHHVPDMEAVAHAAVLSKTTEATNSSSQSIRAVCSPPPPPREAKRAAGVHRRAGSALRDVICSRWFVGSLNALG